MYYKYKKYIENSPNGVSLDIRGAEDNPVTYLGNLEGWDYAYMLEATEQDERLQAEVVTLTPEQKDALRSQKYSKVQKSNARYFIDKEVGDAQDLIADAMKLIEFNMMLTARLAGDLWGTNPIDSTTKEAYKARNKAFLDAVEAGAITLRGDFDDMDLVMQRLLGRVSKTNQLVRDNYVSELQRLGLA